MKTEEEMWKYYVYEGSIKTNPKSATEISLVDLIAPADTLTVYSFIIDGVDCIRLRWWEKVLNLFKLIDIEPRFSVLLTSDSGILGELFLLLTHLYYDITKSESLYYPLQLLKPRIFIKNASEIIIEPRIEIAGYLSSSINEDKKIRG